MHKRIAAPSSLQEAHANLFSVLKRVECKLSALDEKHWTILGNGPIGAKSEELRKKTWAIERAGFVVNPRVVFAMDFFDAFNKRSGVFDALERGASPEELQNLILGCKFNGNEFREISAIANRFSETPIAVRSSAHGDCRGTGIYESTFCVNNGSELKNAAALANAMKEVLASEFSEDAITFRKDLGLPGGMAVIIEPVFGKKYRASYERDEPDACHSLFFGPAFGGIGYTSTSQREGYITIACGIPVGVVKGEGLRVPERYSESVFECYGEYNPLTNRMSTYNKLNLREWLHEGSFVDLYHGKILSIDLSPSWGFCTGIDDERAVSHAGTSWIFPKLKKLEQLLGKPQYVKWAVYLNGDHLDVGILQIAESVPKTDFYEFRDSSSCPYTATYVVGSGQKVCNAVVEICNEEDIPLLREYNRTHSDYLVVVPGRFIMLNKLSYSAYNNASVVIDDFTGHKDSPRSHHEGKMDFAQKILLCEVSYNKSGLDKYERAVYGEKSGKMIVYDVKVRVTASERQQKAIVELLPEDKPA